MSSLARILDANANRAREGLRVLEDLARFSLDDAELSESLKRLRHEVTEGVRRLPIDLGQLMAARDTPGDVGVQIHTASEYHRQSVRDLASAAAGRLTEALRSMAECAKALDAAEAAGLFEQTRYRAYALQQRLILSLGGERRQWRLCVLITESLCGLDWRTVAAEAVAGGADCLQLREKELEGGELLRRAQILRELTRRAGAALVINDRADIALLAEADAVHIGQRDLAVHEVRRLAGFRLAVGVSTSNIEQARRAAAEGADYCGLGPMFPSTTKHKPHLAGPGYVEEYLADRRCSRLPHLAIGGISPENIRELAAAGCRGCAVSSAVCGSPRPGEICRRMIEALAAAGTPEAPEATAG